MLYPAVIVLLASQLYSQKLDVDGTIKISNDLGAPEPGTIRWTGTDFQGWNGTKWVSLTTGKTYEGEVMDIDENVYPTLKIGSQEWMAENLRAGTETAPPYLSYQKMPPGQMPTIGPGVGIITIPLRTIP